MTNEKWILANKLHKIVKDKCKNVPPDIGLELAQCVEEYIGQIGSPAKPANDGNIFEMNNGEKKTSITVKESKDVESIIARETMDKEEAQKYLKMNTLFQDYFREMESARSRIVRTALDNVNGLIMATWDTNK